MVSSGNPAVLTFGHYGDLVLKAASMDDLPDWVVNAFNDAEDNDDFDRMMAAANARCIQTYGVSVEGLDVWRLPENGSWLVIHTEDDTVDYVILIDDMIAWIEFSTTHIALLAQKIMAEDKYWLWKHEMDVRLEQEQATKLH